MQKIYTVITSGYNGTVTVHQSVSSFFSKELAEEACKRIDEVNEDAFLKIHGRVQESVIYESRNEVPVLNTPIEDLKAQMTTHEESQPLLVVKRQIDGKICVAEKNVLDIVNQVKENEV